MNRRKKELKKKDNSIINLVEGTRRFTLGIPSDKNDTTSWKSTLLLIVVLIAVFFIYSLFEK